MPDGFLGAGGGLSASIVERISEDGPITFAEFMATALYSEGTGYYTSGRVVWGKEGDYLTSLDISPAFARTIAKEIARMWELLGSPETFTVIDAGAGRGLLSGGILDHARLVGGGFLDALRLVLIDVSESYSGELKDEERVSFLSDIRDIKEPITGVVVTNELLDALPFHRVVMGPDGLEEIFVAIENGELKDKTDPVSSPFLDDYFSNLGITLMEERKAEVSLEAREWIKRAGAIVGRGFVITIDYGLPAIDLYAPERRDTMLCHHRHKINDDPYRNIGSQDITAHVDFTSVAKAGKEAGLEVAGFCSQQHFLIGAGILEDLIEVSDLEGNPKEGDANAVANNQGIKKLIIPGGMGDIFKVLVQYKGIPAPTLQGFSFKNKSGLLNI